MLKVTRRTREVDVILNQQTAEDIARLGDALAEETTREQITEAGTNRQAKAKTEQAWRNLFDELTDGQFTPIWQAIAELNGTAADPKAAFDLASQVLRN